MKRYLAAFVLIFSVLLPAQDDLKQTGIDGLEKASWVLLNTQFTVRGERTIAVPDEALEGKEINYVAFYVDGELVMVDEIPPYRLKHDFGSFTHKAKIVAVGVRYRLTEPEPATEERGPADDQGAAQAREVSETEAGDQRQDQTQQTAAEQDREPFIPDEDTVRIVSPSSDIYTYGVITLKAEVDAPPERVVRVDFAVDGTVVGSAEEPPYEYDHDFGRGFNEHQVTATAIFSDGQRAEATTTTVPLENSDYFVRTQLVTLDATVVDWRDRIVPDLQKEDFRLWENGVEQDITHFSVEERPIRVALLLDASGSMSERDKMNRAINSAAEFLNFLDPEKDKAALIVFTDIPNLLSGFTNDFPRLREMMNQIRPRGGTAISDTLDATVPLFEDEIGRKAIVLVTDGIDQHSTINVNEAVEKVHGIGAKIYSIGIFIDDYFQQQTQQSMQVPKTRRGKTPDLDPTDARKKDQTFQRGLDTRTVMFEGLADATGGASFFPETLRELPVMFKRIADELRNSYAIGYIPSDKDRDGEWREIDVEVDRSGLTVKTKNGYYAKK